MSVLNADTEKYNSLNDSREGYLIEMKDISKYFPGVKALQNVDFKLKQGEVHCLLGENGAGKSTLIKILSGDYTMDKGEILMEGKPVSIKNSHDAIALGIRTVYQELNLVPGLTVAENMFLGAEIGTGLCEIFVNRREMERKASEVLKKIGVGINPGTLVKDLTTAQQQMVEIARSLTREGRCAIIMDEPTASISEKDTGDLFRIIRELKTQGISIVYISHRMHELYQIADRVTVLRDGQYIGTYGIKNTPMDELVTAMVGREIEKDMRVPHGRTNILAFEAKNINLAPLVKNASFKVCKGEILGFSGLVGSGRTELMRAIFGAEHMDSGEVFINGKKTSIKSPKEAVRAGLCYLSEDRKNQGLVLNMEIYKNITLTNMAAVTNGVFLAKQSELSAALEKANTLSLKYSSLHNAVSTLSGGNQQKVVIAKWLMTNCDVMIFDEPTRGIDVGARVEIYKLLNALATRGKAIIMVSSDLPEILKVSDRIIVMSEGKLVGEFENTGEDISENILSLMIGKH